jgi:hypothetical protein
MPYLTPKWVTSVLQFLFQHNLTLTLTNCLHIRMQGASDKCIMQPKYLAWLTRQQQWDVNLVRLYLQVITLSNMSEAKGQCIKECYLGGVRDNIQKHARKNWPSQATPTKHQIYTWDNLHSNTFYPPWDQVAAGIGSNQTKHVGGVHVLRARISLFKVV